MVYDEYYCIGTKEEIKNYKRTIDFGDEELQRKYNFLLPKYQNCIYNVLNDLSNEIDYFGYNFNNFLKAYKNINESVPQLKLSKQLAKDVEYYLLKYLSKEECNNFLATYKKEKTEKELFINKQLDVIKRTRNPKKKDSEVFAFIETICDYLLADIQLLLTGIGKVYSMSDKWFNKYMADNEEGQEFFILAEKDIQNTWSTKLRMERYEKYLIEKGIISKDERILEEELAVMTNWGVFQKLKRHEQNAIKRLLEELYALQLLDEKNEI